MPPASGTAVPWASPTAAAVFTATFFLLALGRIGRRPVPRGAVALGGGLLTLVLLNVPWTAVDVEVLLLLAGLMALAAMADETGMLAPLQGLVGRAHGRWALPLACAAVALTSAVLLNDAAVVVLVPVLLPILRARGIDAVAATVWMAVAANVGSLLTPFGNPQNAVLARAAGLDLADFLRQQWLVFAVAALLLLVAALRHRAHDATEPDAPPGRQAAVVAVAVTLFIAWAALRPERLGTGAALAAAVAFAVLRPLRGASLEARVVRGVDLNVLALFVGIYLLTAGIPAWFPDGLSPARLDDPATATAAVLAVSNAVGNVPAILALQGLDAEWVAAHAPFLVSISTLGGSILLTGSAASLLAAEAARRQGVEVSFAAFVGRAGPWMAAATAFAAWWMW